jgi:hypothetical protein
MSLLRKSLYGLGSVAVVTVAIAIAGPGTVSAQSNGTWVNAELKAKGITGDQLQAIGRGDAAECSADARERTMRTFPRLPDCFNNTDPGNAGACGQAYDSVIRQREMMYRDSTVGCMARRGWLLTNQR